MFFTKVNNWINNNKAITYLLLFLLLFVFFSWIQYSPTFADPDSFYHTKMAQLVADNGAIQELPQLQFTNLRDNFVDHHFLYHLYLVPFVKVFPPLVGIKIGHILLECFAILAFFWLLNRLKVYGAIWYVIMLLFVEVFVFRISLIKAQPLSLMILFISTYLIVKKRYLLLFLLSFIYVWSYGGWFLILLMALLYVFVESLTFASNQLKESWFQKLLDRKGLAIIDRLYNFIISFVKNVFSVSNIKLIVSITFGLAAGIIINPYFPKNLEFFWVHIVKIAFINYQHVIGVGSEWYPYDISDLFVNAMIPFTVGFVALVIYLNYRHKMDVVVKYALALFIVFILATLKSRRNIEYLSPYAIIFAALVFSQSMKIKEIRNDFKEFKRIVKNIFLNDWYTKIILIVAIIFLLVAAVYRMPYHAKVTLDRGINYNYLKGASDYIADNSDEGDIVFHSDWDEFPILFFHNSKNNYIVGLDATFMYLYDKDLYEKWADITLGKRYKNMHTIIKEEFGAKYIIATTDHEAMIRNLDNNFYFDKVYSDSEAVVYKVL